MKKYILIASSIIALTGLYVALNYVRPLENLQQAPSGFEDQQPAPSGAAGGGGVRSPVSYVFDYNDPRVLVGYTQEVFAAKVLKEIGRNPAVLAENTQIPHFQYEAEVLYNIKGSANGKVMLDFDAIEGGRLVSGNTYLLAMRHWEETRPWYYVGSHPAFKLMVSDNASLTDEQLIELVKKHERTYELLNAYPNEILRDIDIRKNRTPNSFQSLSDEEKQVVYAKFEELIPLRPVPDILPPPPPPTPVLAESDWIRCRDGVDNDNDGLIDIADPDCGGTLREDLPSLCRDHEDNDLDGLVDAADPDCAPFYPEPAPPPPPPTPIPATSSVITSEPVPEPEPEPTSTSTSTATSTQ